MFVSFGAGGGGCIGLGFRTCRSRLHGTRGPGDTWVCWGLEFRLVGLRGCRSYRRGFRAEGSGSLLWGSEIFRILGVWRQVLTVTSVYVVSQKERL